MCDTSVAIGSATADGSVIFAKNSDRKANECQPLGYYPRQEHPTGGEVRCTHRTIPQVRETHAMLGSRPYWMWGFEMGVNEHGVAIGNEAVHGRDGYAADGLLGMDLLRLGLERGRTADEALQVIVDLLETFGQGGIADIVDPRSYHNSYIIADPRVAWVLETAGRHWAAERVRGKRAISNCYTITTTWDAASPDLIDFAVKRGWWRGPGDFSFADAYGDPAYDATSGQCRFRRSSERLREQAGLTAPDLLAILRDHDGARPNGGGQPTAFPICMHATPPRVGETAASLVVHLRADQPAPRQVVAWHSFGSPCLSAATPFYVEAGPIPPALAVGGDRYDPNSPCWLIEGIQRRADVFPGLQGIVRAAWGDLERDSFARARQIETDATAEMLAAFSASRVAALLDTARELDRRTKQSSASQPLPSEEVRAHWSALNEPVGLDLFAVHA